MRGSLVFELGTILVPLAAGVLLMALGLAGGWVTGLVLLPYLLRSLYHLLRLASRMRRRERLAPPYPRGVWGEIYRAVSAYQQRGRKNRKRQIRFIRRFREAANSVPDALVILDKQHRIEWANPAAGNLMDIRWPRDEERPLADLLPHDDLSEFVDVGDYARPLYLVPAHNRALTLSLRITPFGERKRQRLLVGRDVTKLYHLNMIRRDFVANASHELRTPLTVIAGFLENLANAPGTPGDHKRPLELMRNQTKRMGSIVDDLLTLSRLEMDDQTDGAGSIDELVDIPEELRLILREARSINGRGHRIESSVDDELLLRGNQPELRSALSNLVLNAMKHTPDGSRIRVIWRDEREGPLFAVEDNGGGIAAEHLPRLTERFYRVDPARSRASGGTGLGLAIVKHVLNRHDAALLIASEVGQGSRFACLFPDSRRIYRQRPAVSAVG